MKRNEGRKEGQGEESIWVWCGLLARCSFSRSPRETRQKKKTKEGHTLPAAAMAISLQQSVFCVLSLLLFSASTCTALPNLQILKADRKIDLTSQIVRIATVIRVENAGPDVAEEVLLAFSKDAEKNLAYLRVTSAEGRGKTKGHVLLSAVPSEVESPANVSYYSIRLDKPLKRDGAVNIEIYAAYTDLLKPFPEEISQSDVQLVLYHDSAYFLSPYPVKMQSASLKVPSYRVESFTNVEGGKHSDGEIRYGPYENVAALSYLPVTVHFENNSPFAVAKTLEREIEISHWGSIYITEKYDVKHAGARHKGVFSRFDYQSKPGAVGVSSFRQLRATLPPRVHSVYYRDEIGNISTSHLRTDLRKSELELEPRYPLFGGWEVTFTIGYGVPLEDFVFKTEDGLRYLNMSFTSPFAGLVVEDLTVKVVLPEGSRAKSTYIPFIVDEDEETKYTYLDTVGRPVVVLRKKNVIPEHNVYFQVVYKFATAAMFAEPLMLVAGFFAFFAASIAYIHLDFSISKSSASYQARAQREEVQNAVQRLQKIFGARAAVSEKLESSLRDLARTGDVAAAKAVRKTADASLKETAKELKAAYDSLPASSRSTVLAKVDTLIQKEREKQEKLQQKHTVTVEAYEKKMSSKDIDSRIAPYQQKLTVLKQEVAELLHLLDD